MLSKIVLDTSIIINGEIARLVKSGSLDGCEIIIPEAVIDELRAQASQKQEYGIIGLEEIRRIKDDSAAHSIRMVFKGARPTAEDVRLAPRGRIDAMIKDVAKQDDAALYTSDRVQSMVAEAEGIPTRLVVQNREQKELEFLRFFDRDTMSVHLKEGMTPVAKRGAPGAFELSEVEKTALSRDYLRHIAAQIVEAAKTRDAGPEIARPGALVIQYCDYRIAITQPPFSEGYEITIVHPTARMSLDDYTISEKLMARLEQKAEGILISGAPGSGKSTLASGLANFYNGMGKIVKTFESPRDLQVDPGITQYTKLDGSFENTADVLLLVRPDYTIFDEVRRREDFGVFADLRLSGVGMIGVVHANSPVDAVQRFIGKIEMGMIPSVLDTVVFVRDGRIDKVYGLELKVKVPSGMAEQDLARPVIEIRSFDDGKLEYEIYTFGEENVIIPVTQEAKTGVEKLAEDHIRDTFRRFDPHARVEILSQNSVRVHVAKHHMGGIIGRGGSNIAELEKSLNIHIDIVESTDSAPEQDLEFTFSESKSALVLTVDKQYARMHADVFAGGDFVASSRIGRNGQIKLPRRASAAKKISRLAHSQDEISIRTRDF